MTPPKLKLVLRQLLCLLILLAAAGQAPAADSAYVRFLPNDGNNVYPASGLLRQWPAEGPPELWRAHIGPGKSAVIEAGGRAFTEAQADGKQWLSASMSPAAKHSGKPFSPPTRTITKSKVPSLRLSWMAAAFTASPTKTTTAIFSNCAARCSACGPAMAQWYGAEGRISWPPKAPRR